MSLPSDALLPVVRAGRLVRLTGALLAVAHGVPALIVPLGLITGIAERGTLPRAPSLLLLIGAISVLLAGTGLAVMAAGRLPPGTPWRLAGLGGVLLVTASLPAGLIAGAVTCGFGAVVHLAAVGVGAAAGWHLIQPRVALGVRRAAARRIRRPATAGDP